MKRIIGNLILVGVLSGGAAVASASPSSALPRNGCLDEQHWWAQVSAMSAEASFHWDMYDALEHAEERTNPEGSKVWLVTFANGAVVAFTSHNAVEGEAAVQYGKWTTASNAVIDFYNNMTICDL